MSIAIILARATLMPPSADAESSASAGSDRTTSAAKIVLPTTSLNAPSQAAATYSGISWQQLYPSDTNTTLSVYSITLPNKNPSKRQRTDEQEASNKDDSRQTNILQLAHCISNFLLESPSPQQESPLEYYRKPGGVLLLAMSLVASRGKDTLSHEMDDSYSKLTSQFGHCSQELMNLLLTGQAVSNVFDNTLTPSGGGLTLRGIQARPDIGYLSQLEALRYLQVGDYYKSPTFPIWVVGSTSHFTVLFGEASCLQESKSDVLLEKCRRAFKSIQGAEENGYIPTDSLKEVLGVLDLSHIGQDALYPVLTAMVEMGGIVVWDEFWKVASRLLTGASLESVLERGNNDDGMPPLLLPNGKVEGDKKPAARTIDDGDKKPSARTVTFQDVPSFATVGGGADMPESDEEMARRLAQEWGAGELNSPPAAAAPAAAAAARPASPMEMDTTFMSADEQLARKLQAEAWEESKSSGPISVDAFTDAPPPLEAGSDLQGESIMTMEDPAAGDSKLPATRRMEFETFGNSFRLYHYNGLRGGSLTPFRVTRLTAEEAVGASVPLTNAGNKGPAGAASGDLEDVLRTKWPSCEIDWLGASSPSID